MKITNPAGLKALLEGDIENAIMASTLGGIEAQEKRGQQQLLESALMPRIQMEYGELDSRTSLERLGFVILGEADDLFYNTQLPAGWKRQGTSHSMHSNVLDAEGRERVNIFYKAAFYDRRAHLWVVGRYKPSYEPVNGWDNIDYKAEANPWVALASDGGREIWRSEVLHLSASSDASKVAREWLDSHFPQWQDPFAYWDDAEGK